MPVQFIRIPCADVPHGPHIVRPGCGDTRQRAPLIGSRDDLPGSTVPVNDQRVGRVITSDVVTHRPGIRRGERQDAVEVRTEGTAWEGRTRDDMPGAAVPALDQRLKVANGPDATGGTIPCVADRPELIGAWDMRHLGVDASGRSLRPWAADDTPYLAVPVLDQSIADAWSVSGVADGPDVVRGDRGHTAEITLNEVGIGAGHDAPLRAVPVHDQGGVDILLVLIVPLAALPADSPDVIGGHCRDTVQVARTRIGDEPPGRAVPPFDERGRWTGRPGEGAAHRPGDGRRERAHGVQIIGWKSLLIRDVRAGHDAPGRGRWRGEHGSGRFGR